MTTASARRVRAPLFACLLLVAGGQYLSAAQNEVEWQWRDATEFSLQGQGWQDVKSPYDRLPARAESLVRGPVWSLAQHSAGLYVDFRTNATAIAVRWTVRGERLAMSHMPASGVSGVDLYVREKDPWRFLNVGQPRESAENEAVLVRGLTKETRHFRLYLPLYNGVLRLEIGVPSGTMLEATRADDAKPVVFYGTSITQGGCASRPGMAYPAILGRRLDVPTINLGFSGNGKTEPELAELLAELSPAAFVLDSLPNLETQLVGERLPGFIDTLRESHPRVPIVLVENLVYTDAPFVATRRERSRESNRVLQEIYEARVADGDKHLFYVAADDLIGRDGEATVDGTHPTDLGFMRIADTLEPVLRQALLSRNAARP